MEDGLRIGGTLVWYYTICPREAWLMAHQITPDEDDEQLVIGRVLHEMRQARGAKEVEIGASKVDLLRTEGGALIVTEVKKSAKASQSARMQMLYYLLELKERGIEAMGELVFSEERRKEAVVLTPEEELRLKALIQELRGALSQPIPPAPERISYCRRCAYAEYCWA
ncbi:MAG: CRISPR-associated protein Cas4 [Alicyclobacillus herbarius]|uniref:CRISPR-associated protein Cas4 n=1 Tax=Alicyclobacillus herbarius TaxID=122960 RepID=UPI00040A3B70|nr:CRISPR-associated protein Cas4 [Alicyclobacillus herbarius]MCL6633563.1 CRISPR-associated protein Cas4 [Alicyclobacillus herbarius]